jgi:RNA polymerase sigma-70 factor (ECF subfamily)
MAPDDEEHLSRMVTHWSLVFRAHQGPGTTAETAARQELLLRYCGAVFRYLRSAVRDDEAAKELCQEFGLRFARGDFHRAHPDKGRFRDLLKTALIHLIADWWRGQKWRPRPLDSAVADGLASAAPDAEQEFDNQWRGEMIDQAWKRLAEFEAERADRWLCRALRHAAEHPDQSAAQMAAALGPRLNAPLTEENVRKTLKRARDKFAALLLEEVSLSLGGPTPQQLRDEVIELGLLPYCEPALAQRGLEGVS